MRLATLEYINHPPLLELYRIQGLDLLDVPFYVSYISAGFPSPADDYLDDSINLSDYLVRNPSATFVMRVRGNSMIDANIRDGAVLVVDRSVKPADGLIAACYLDGAFTVKTIRLREGKLYLEAANAAYPDIEVAEEMEMRVFGIVTYIIHQASKR
ncbi:translesion error-prone DNA polymerase V autoproteolytic subunit [Pontibacter sp. BT731]|uniref:LexA family protein n=1 Tax=Pontibacter coccineus TaxID=3063328 RepID=UPI0026E48D20|nr:translesion error-prone DNA polymerase V autoproteolytic subunit [Pontibacter sp. BT731]MDO6392071.1 translesion error-prone DNA polymerase V autoproteolytic subunit [Pontibacter sp. BT731]